VVSLISQVIFINSNFYNFFLFHFLNLFHFYKNLPNVFKTKPIIDIFKSILELQLFEFGMCIFMSIKGRGGGHLKG